MTHSTADSPLGWWTPLAEAPTTPLLPENALLALDRPVYLVGETKSHSFQSAGRVVFDHHPPSSAARPLLAAAPPLKPQHLGNPAFLDRHQIRFPYVVGAMANAITSETMVEKAGRAGMIGFFGAGGCTLARIRQAIGVLKEAAKKSPFPFGFNFLHHPGSPETEMAVADLYLSQDIRCVSAAAFMRMTPAIVRYRVSGVTMGENGHPIARNRVIAKVSRVELAEKFLSPPPQRILNTLVASGYITPMEAELAATLPMADDITAEADSGGHTDNRPAMALLPSIQEVRDRLCRLHQYPERICVGLAGGIATPASAAAAFALGADYILAGSIHQSCVEAGTSSEVKEMLARCQQADVIMAPAADMFEMGGRVQVLKRETMFAMRAQKLFSLYREYDSLEALPPEHRNFLEEKIFHRPLQAEWESTKQFFLARDPGQIEKAQTNPKHRMALVFRSYLGQASLWAIAGDPNRKVDYQIWCGPAMGAFNAWTKDTFLSDPAKREVAVVAANLLVGAVLHTRFRMLKTQFPHLPDLLGHIPPMEKDQVFGLL